MINISTYTTTLNEVMKDINNRTPKPIPEMIEESRKVIFDFDYETPSLLDKNDFKKWFETTFLSKFILWEIGFDTYEQFHLQLYSKCSRIMPSDAMKIDMMIKMKGLEPKDLMKIKKGTVLNKHNDTNTDNMNTINKSIHSTLPANLINANTLGKTQYADDGVRNESDRIDTFENNGKDDTTYDLIYGGHIEGIKLFMELFDKDFKNIYEQLLNEFNYLFLGVM